MPFDRLDDALRERLAALDAAGTRKGEAPVITEVLAPEGSFGPRYRLRGEGERAFLRMNANGYLGMALDPEVVAAEEAAVRAFGTGPQAVRFISGSFAPHIELEAALAAFHGREAAIVYSSAYATVMGVLPPLIDAQTAVVSDDLNHNCIINAIRLARPAELRVYAHLDLDALEAALVELRGAARRVLLVTDGVFSMRGDHAPLSRITEIAQAHDAHFEENVCVIVDDSHGVGASGATGRGTEEVCGAQADVLVGTLGKAFGANGGYLVGSAALVALLREQSPFYVYSNPIGPGEAAAARKALAILDSDEGRRRLARLRTLTQRFEAGLLRQGFDTISGPHPIVPLLVRDTAKTASLVRHLFDHGILVTGLAHPVVPRGEEEIRFQISAEHTEADIDTALEVLAAFER